MDFSRLDAYMEAMPERGIPSCDLAVTKDGKLVYRKMVGYSDVEKTKPVSENDIYWVFSTTKVVTCVMAMRLVEQGIISLDDPVSKYLPAYKHTFVKNSDGTISRTQNEMRIVHLFTMTGGLDYNVSAPNVLRAVERTGGDTVAVAESLAEAPLLFEPGTHYRYSLCHDVLAAVVEVASGMKFRDYVKKYLTDPLGMKDTGFCPTDEQRSRFSTMYRYVKGAAKADPIVCKNELVVGENYDSGGAGLFSTVSDYIKFVTVLANGGVSEDGYRLLKPESIQMMTKNYLCDDAIEDFVTTRLNGYGWGLCGRVHMNSVVSHSRSSVGEFGWDSATACYAMVDVTERVAFYSGMHVRGCAYAHHILNPTIRNLIYEGLEN